MKGDLETACNRLTVLCSHVFAVFDADLTHPPQLLFDTEQQSILIKFEVSFGDTSDNDNCGLECTDLALIGK
jgi:hypothetical protein